MELLIRVFTSLLWILYQLLRPYFWYINRQPGAKITSAKNPILKLSAVVIAEKIRQKELSSEAVVSAYIERIKEVNHLLNAVIEDRFEAAIQEARICDKKLADGDVTAKQLELEKPLYGVPITVKESCALKGLSHTGGSIARIEVKANYDGKAVLTLKNAGAIPLCVTNTPELCLGLESVNNIFGITNNPYDVRRTAGGSSGGEGALLGSSASLIGVGSDVAGSIRVPAHVNGIFGHKPTPGVIPIEGHLPYVEDPDLNRYLVVGPMTRYAEDLALAVRVMAKQNSAALRLDIPVDVKSLKVCYMEEIQESFGLLSTQDEIKGAIKNAAGYLQGVGADVQKVNIEGLNNSLDLGLALIYSAKELPQMLLNPEDPKHESNTLTEAGKWLLGSSRHTLSAILCKFMKDTRGFVPRSKLPFHHMEMQKLHRTFADLLGTNGVLLFPTFVRSAPFHNQMTLQFPGAMYSMVINVLGYPSTNVPMGFDGEGLPVGIQVIANPMQDRLCLAVAKELEKGFGGWIPPPTTTAEH